jgi:hypothetical protein
MCLGDLPNIGRKELKKAKIQSDLDQHIQGGAAIPTGRRGKRIAVMKASGNMDALYA